MEHYENKGLPHACEQINHSVFAIFCFAGKIASISYRQWSTYWIQTKGNLVLFCLCLWNSKKKLNRVTEYLVPEVYTSPEFDDNKLIEFDSTCFKQNI